MKKLPCYMSSTHMNSHNDWIACIEQAKAMGFDGVELFSGENGVNFADMPEERCMEIARRAQELNVRISAHPWVNWEHLPEDELIVRYRELIACCIRMGMTEINMHMHFLATREQGMQRIFAATDPCIESLKKANAILLYEDVPEHGARELGSDAADFDQLFAHYAPDSNVMMNIDSGHAHIMGHLDHLVRKHGSRWRYTHIDDNDGVNDLHVAPGTGSIDFAAFAQAAQNANYSGVPMMEYHENHLSTGMPVLEQAYSTASYTLSNIQK